LVSIHICHLLGRAHVRVSIGMIPILDSISAIGISGKKRPLKVIPGGGAGPQAPENLLLGMVQSNFTVRWEREGGATSLAQLFFWPLSATFVADSGQKRSILEG
jgi:hypothetical protein